MNSQLRLKHVIHFNPSSLAELETPHAQASWAQGSCCAGQARRAGAASSAQLRQRPCEGQWGQDPEQCPARISVRWRPYCGTRAGPLPFTRPSITASIPQRTRAWSAALPRAVPPGNRRGLPLRLSEAWAAVGSVVLASRFVQAPVGAEDLVLPLQSGDGRLFPLD